MALQPVGKYLHVKQDSWLANSCIVFPVQEMLEPAVAELALQPALPLWGDAYSDQLLHHVCAAIRALGGHNATDAFVVMTQVFDRLVLVLHGGGSEVDRVVDTQLSACTDTHLFFSHAIDAAVRHAEYFPVNFRLFACYCQHVCDGTVTLPVGMPAGAGFPAFHRSSLTLVTRPAGPAPSVTGFVAVIDARGCVFALHRCSLSPLVAPLYIKLYEHAHDLLVPDQLTTAAAGELAQVLHSLTRMTDPLYNGDTAMASAALPGLPVPPSDVSAATFLSGMDLSPLWPAVHQALSTLAMCTSLQQWLEHQQQQQHDATGQTAAPFRLQDASQAVRAARTRVLIQAMVELKDEVWREDGGWEANRASLALQLSSPVCAMAECHSLVFDLLLLGADVSDVPPTCHPAHLLTDAYHSDCFLTVHLLMHWRQTLQRFVEVAARSHLDSMRAVAAQCAVFRVGLLVQPRGAVPVVKCAHRVVDRHHCFFVNVSDEAMQCKPTLQQQRAEERNFVVAYFIRQALFLLAPLLNPGNGMEACCALIGSYMGALKPNSLFNLSKAYDKVQGDARTLRQKAAASRACVLPPPLGGEAARRTRSKKRARG
jgi:hypothetical protein